MKLSAPARQPMPPREHRSSFIEKVRLDFEQWKQDGVCARAQSLNEAMGSNYFDVANPHHFAGDLDSAIVLIHLNPKRNPNQYGARCEHVTFDDYWQAYEKFGERHYGPKSSGKHKSPFDHKQVRFLKPLGVIPFVEDDERGNLRRVIDEKLQLELIPYGSPDFNFHGKLIENLKPFVEDIIRLICAVERKHIIFCGRVFTKLLAPFSRPMKTHNFRLEKNDGTWTKHEFEIVNIMLQSGGEDSGRACILPQFAKQGYPVGRYGQKLAELYSEN